MPLFSLLIRNDLNEVAAAQYVGEKFCAFSQAGKSVAPLASARATDAGERERTIGVLCAYRHMPARDIEGSRSRQVEFLCSLGLLAVATFVNRRSGGRFIRRRGAPLISC